MYIYNYVYILQWKIKFCESSKIMLSVKYKYVKDAEAWNKRRNTEKIWRVSISPNS